MNVYIAFFNGKKIEVRAASSYAAQQAAVAQFKPRKSQAHLVHVVLAERDGAQVVHVPTE